MDPHKKKKKSKVTPSEEKGGLINSSFELDVNSDPAMNNGKFSKNNLNNTFHESVKAAVEKSKLSYDFHAVVEAKQAAGKWHHYTRTKRIKKQRNGVDDDENESSTVGGIGLDTDVENKSQFAPFGEKKRQSAADRSLIDYFARLGKSKDPNEVIDLNFVESLIKNGANINCTDKHGQTLLHEVSRTWHTDVAKFLFEKKADINKADKFGRTALHVAAAVDYPEMVDLLIANGANKEALTLNEQQTPVHYAAKNDAVSSLKMLINNGCKYDDVRDYRGRTPIFVAAELDRSESARYLLEMNASVKISDNNGQKTLSWMITKMPPVAIEALKQFHMTDRPNRKQYFELQHLVHARAHDSNPTPLVCAVQYKQYDIIMNKVVIQLLDKMWAKYARWRVWVNVLLNFIYIILWSLLGVLIEYDERYNYKLPEHWWRIVLLLAAIGMTVWQFIEEIIEFKRSHRTSSSWKKVRRKNIEDDLKYCHPRWPEEKAFLESELKNLEEGDPKYFSDAWNWFDYICYAFLLACIITHIVDIFNHSTMLALNHIRVMSITIILLWVRLMKIVRAFSLLGPFIVMLSHMTKDLLRFLFLYMEFYIPFVFAFWMIFGGDKVKYGDLGRTQRENFTIGGYRAFNEVLFSLFRLTLVDDYPFDDMQSVDPVMTYILVGSWLALSAVIFLNLLIALLSDTFQRVYDNAQANAVMQKAITITNTWEGLSVSSRKRFLNHINKKCAPLQLYYDDDMTEAGEEDLQKVTIQIKEDLDDFRQKWEDKFGSLGSESGGNGNDGDNGGGGGGGGSHVSVEKFENEIEVLREGIKEMQVRQDDMMDAFRRDIGLIKSLLCEVTGRAVDELEAEEESADDLSSSRKKDKVKKLKKKKRRRTPEPLEEPLLEPSTGPIMQSAPTVDVSTVDFSPSMFPQVTRSSTYSSMHDPSSEA